MAKIQGLDALKRKLAALPRETKREIRGVLEKSATEMVVLAKGLAPVDDGNLQMSIRQQPGRHELAVEVRAGGEMTTREVRAGSGVDYDYSIAVEFGTSDTAEQPFFWPSYRAIKRRAKNRATRAVRKAARAAIAGGS
jgi:HK97 gp10 family phage protein